MLFYVKEKCFSVAHFCSLVFMAMSVVAAFLGALLPLIGINRILGWIVMGAVFLSLALFILSAIAGGGLVLAMRFVIRNRILKEGDLEGMGSIAFTSPSIMYCEIAKKATDENGYTCIPLVVFGDTGKVRDAVYLAVKAGMTVFGMYQREMVPGYQFYYRFGGTL